MFELNKSTRNAFLVILIVFSIQTPVAAGPWDFVSGGGAPFEEPEDWGPVFLVAALAYGASVVWSWYRASEVETLMGQANPSAAAATVLRIADYEPSSLRLVGRTTEVPEETTFGDIVTRRQQTLEIMRVENAFLREFQAQFLTDWGAEELVIRYDAAWPGFTQQLYGAYQRLAELYAAHPRPETRPEIEFEFFYELVVGVTEATMPEVREYLTHAMGIFLGVFVDTTGVGRIFRRDLWVLSGGSMEDEDFGRFGLMGWMDRHLQNLWGVLYLMGEFRWYSGGEQQEYLDSAYGADAVFQNSSLRILNEILFYQVASEGGSTEMTPTWRTGSQNGIGLLGELAIIRHLQRSGGMINIAQYYLLAGRAFFPGLEALASIFLSRSYVRRRNLSEFGRRNIDERIPESIATQSINGQVLAYLENGEWLEEIEFVDDAMIYYQRALELTEKLRGGARGLKARISEKIRKAQEGETADGAAGASTEYKGGPSDEEGGASEE